MKKVVRIFNNCIIVKGYLRNVLFDMLSEKIHVIPKSLSSYLSISSLSSYRKFPKDVIDEYESFLIENNLGFKYSLCGKRLFSDKITKGFDFPAAISNMIIYNDGFKKIDINELNNCGVYVILIILDRKTSAPELDVFLSSLTNSSVASVEFVILNENFVDLDSLFSLFMKHKQVVKIIAHSKKEQEKITQFGRLFRLTSMDIELCSKIDKFGLFPTRMFYCESQQYNTCLNRKLCIDKDGYIKNCPSMEHHYGHISNTNIEDVVKLPEFQKWWHIKKDNISVCSGCEFRYFCHDCRAFTVEDKLFEKPLNCSYNPKTTKWK